MFSLVDQLKQLAVNVHCINDYIKTEVLVNIFFPVKIIPIFRVVPLRTDTLYQTPLWCLYPSEGV